MITFVCDLCGAPGRVPESGYAQCDNCGRVVKAPVTPPASLDASEADPVAPADIADPPPHPPRSRGAMVAIGTLAAGAALAMGVAVAIRSGWIGGKPSAAAAGYALPPAAPVAQTTPRTPEPPPAPVVSPKPPSRSPEVGAPARKPARLASTLRSPAPAAGEDGFAPRAHTFLSAEPADRQCVPKALRARRNLTGRLPAEITVRFPVMASGAVGPIEVLGNVTNGEVAEAIENAIRSCPFQPGTDEDGRPTTQSVTMRIRFPAGSTLRSR